VILRTLILLRHAKSSWDQPELADVDRPLAERGQQAAPAMARHLSAQGLVPQVVLCSHAERVRQTWELLAPELGRGVACRVLRSLYLAAPRRLLQTVRRLGDDVEVAMMIGHNPGLASLAVTLAGRGRKKNLARLRRKFPTAALAVLEFEVATWKDLAPGTGRLAAFVRPKDLA
jgi:phosphohistidine phosphatase